ncbi:MAG: cation:proton antiporter [Oscillospiraceae bacterium]|nr:cation:proton antiporter [Oscillospiraceae bacterium]MBQ6698942.1 cation:proton antiporter [Oscillospiraceae bacterium]MBQ7054742.1 cation:proton antiporter [Oscillospiraceae bacterium]
MMGTLLTVSVALLAGLLMTRVFKPLKLPSVTAYLIAGVLIGPYCLGALGITNLGFNSHSAVEALALVSEVALGFIAFSIGSEFRLEELKKTGKQAFVIGIVQALVATLFVDLALLVVHLIMPEVITVPQLITLGAIATATAPAATLMVVRQYKAKGPLTDLLLPIVALDDAVGLIVFAVSFGIAKSIVVGQVDMVSIIVNPLVEIVCSLGLGAIMGWILTQLEKLYNSNTNRLNLTIAFVFLTAALSMMEFHIGSVHVSFSSLLVCMMMGTIFCNICPLSHDLMERSDKWTSPLLALFFVISGAELELNVFANIAIVLIGLVYIIFRSLGKYTGTFISAKATKCSPEICKYLGITLLPQAGVALGMCALAMVLPDNQGALIRNITLFAVLIYELFGPVFTRMALTAAGDIKPMSDEVKNRRQTKLDAAKQKAEN